MSQLNSFDHNFELEKSSLELKTESPIESHNSVENEDMNDKYIISLLNYSSDSDKVNNSVSVLNDSEKVEDESFSSNPNQAEVSTMSSAKGSSSELINNCKENINNVLCDVEVGDLISSKKDDELKVIQRTEYRDSDSPWTEDEDTSSSSSSDSDFHFEPMPRSSSPKVNCVKTKGELDIEDLPPIEYLKISVEEQDLKNVGKVHAVVSKLVVIQATKDEKPLDIDSVLFLAPNEPLGRIFEVFGPVSEPFYTVLFNSAEDIVEKGVKVGSEVFFAPNKNEITSYVFIDMLRQQKGSDASWKDNNEPPEEHLDYSDDEQERAAKQKRKAKNRVRESDDESEVQIIPYKISPNEKRAFNYTTYTRNNGYETQNIRNQNGRSSTQTIRSSAQSDSSNLDNVPVWISGPPSYLEPKPLPLQTSATSTPQMQSFQLRQPASFSKQKQPFNPSTSSQNQFRGGDLMLNPKQPFVPRQPPPNINSQKVLINPQFQPVVSRNAGYPQRPPQPIQLNSQFFQRPPQQMQPNGRAQYFQGSPLPQPVMFQNMNQHVFGQVTPVGVMSPMPPMSPAPPLMSPAMYSPCPSPGMYNPPSPGVFLPSMQSPPPNSFWRPVNQPAQPFSNVVMSPPPTAPLTIQIPNFSTPPPVRFPAASSSSGAPLSYQFPTRP